MHILIIPSWYPNTKNDLAGVFFREQAISLSQLGQQVGVISLNLRSLRKPQDLLKGGFGVDIENDFGVNTYRYKGIRFVPGLNNTINKVTWVNRGLKLFEKYVKENGFPDLIHVQSILYAGVLALEINKKYNIPFIVTEHTSLFHRNLISQKNIKLSLKVAKAAKYRIAVSQEFAKLMKKILKSEEEWMVIPNIVEETFFKYSYDYLEGRDFNFINIARLVEGKRHIDLINAFNEAYKIHKNLNLLIGGAGPLEIILKNKVKELNLEHKVKFLGLLSRDEVIRSISKSHVYVQTSEYETFGIALAEALALGKPIVTTLCGGANDIVNNINGIGVPPKDIELIAKSMLDIYNNYNNYDRKLIREDAYSKFSQERINQKIIEIYSKAIENE